jgi:hypothetical protein
MILLAVAIGLLAAPPTWPPVYGAAVRAEAKGTLQPVEITKLYAPSDGKVIDIKAKSGERINPGFSAVYLYSPELEKRYTELSNEIGEAEQKERSLAPLVNDEKVPPEQRATFRAQMNMAGNSRIAKMSQRNELDKKYNMVPNMPGMFRAVAPPFDPRLDRPAGESVWTVLNENRNETLYGRTVRPNEELVRLGNIEGNWQVELKIPQRNVGQIARAFVEPGMHKTEADGRKYLDVDVLLASMPDTRYLGRLYQSEINAEAVPNKNEHDENEPVVTAYVKLNLKNVKDFPEERFVPRSQFVTGLEVRTRIRCGDHSVGYAYGHGVWEWFYEKVVFFF